MFEGVPQYTLNKSDLPKGIIDTLSVDTQVFPSKGECRKMIQGGGLSINKDKCNDVNYQFTEADLLDGKYILVQRGKKNYYILKFE